MTFQHDLAQKCITKSKDQMGQSGSRVITLKPTDSVTAITMFLQDADGACYCITIGHFISKGEICWLPRNSGTMKKLSGVNKDNLDKVHCYLKLGECVVSIDELTDIRYRPANDLWDKMDVALIKVYDDVVQHLDLVLRDEANSETTVVISVPEKGVKVKHYRYGKISRGKVTHVDPIHGIFHIKPSTVTFEKPKGVFGALVSERGNQDGETKVYGMVITYSQSRNRSYYYIALQMDTVIERLEIEMDEEEKDLQCYSLNE